MEVVTDDVLVLYHMQLSENQLLRQRLESLQQQLLNVRILWSWMLISSTKQIILQLIRLKAMQSINYTLLQIKQKSVIIFFRSQYIFWSSCRSDMQECNYRDLHSQFQNQSSELQSIHQVYGQRIHEIETQYHAEKQLRIRQEGELRQLKEKV